MRSRKRTSFQIFRSVVFALIVREMKTRFGVWRLGYIWAILEPLIGISALVVIISFIRGREPWFNIPVPVFVACGFMLFQYFRTLSTQAANSINSNKALFGYRQVKPFDTLVSRTILETLIFISTVATLSVIGYWFFDYNLMPHDPLRAGLVILLLIVVSFGLGLSFAVFGTLFPELAKLLPVISRPLLFISCVMYPLASIPSNMQHWLLWNPLLHAIEQFRYSMFPYYPGEETSILYLLKSAIFVTTIGLLVYTSQRHKLVST
ncbi:MAG: ABC transporter permease [Oligoflexus sp.]